MYKDIVVRAYGQKEIKKIELLIKEGVNITELVLKAILAFEIPSRKETC